MSVLNPFDFFLEPYAERFPFAYEDWQLHELAPYLAKLPASPRFAEYLAAVPREPKPTVDFLVALNQRLARDIRYLIRMEPGVQTPEETLEKASGSCRDSGWLLVQLLRHLGLAARFVSGYLIQLKPDVKPLDGPSGTDVDFTDLHAWCEVYLPGAGWIGLDPTSGLLAGEGHIPLACTPEPASAAPVTGDVGRVRDDVRARDERGARVGSPARHQALHRRAVDQHRGARPPHRRRPRGTGRAADDGRRAHLRLGRRPRRRRVEHRCAGAAQAAARREPACEAQGALCAQGHAALRAGQVVPGRAAAALVAQLLLAQGRRAAVGQDRAVRRRKRGLRRERGAGRRCSWPHWRPSSGSTRSACSRPTKTPGTTCGASADCRPTSIRSIPDSTTVWSARACGRCSARAWTRSPDTCCRWHAPTRPARAGKAAPGSCATNAVT